ncbi:molybdenum cofactor biosynthesis protein B [Halostella sp. JP-L12]|uniref:MogA/MoaB family molybdenum cofactor biosynthesis protein n=1 Tax=Halostella TaxID=1843185 RepID=UPI0013CEEA43|nr:MULTISPECIES: MogA/MoaB family molybdenum cofactor biosynthesis protein [Halostella]NHN47052.1 molybdenum cofactor biosynthesis protein B [Halostella sp. JP-L12]
MVDFQSRDTRRGLEDDDEDDGETESTDDAASAAESEEDDRSARPADENAGEPTGDSGEHAGDSGGSERAGSDHQSAGSGHGGHDHDEHGGHSHEHDRHHAHDLDALGVAVVTVSSSRTLSDDPAGDTITAVMEEGDDEVVTRELIPDEYDRIEGTIDNLVKRDDVDLVITTGGTGVTPDDVTIEAAKRLFDKELPGFGELFRLLSYDEIGTKVVATRATAGVIGGVPVFCLPGSENAARLGTEAIVSEQAAHIAGLAQRDE